MRSSACARRREEGDIVEIRDRARERDDGWQLSSSSSLHAEEEGCDEGRRCGREERGEAMTLWWGRRERVSEIPWKEEEQGGARRGGVKHVDKVERSLRREEGIRTWGNIEHGRKEAGGSWSELGRKNGEEGERGTEKKGRKREAICVKEEAMTERSSIRCKWRGGKGRDLYPSVPLSLRSYLPLFRAASTLTLLLTAAQTVQGEGEGEEWEAEAGGRGRAGWEEARREGSHGSHHSLSFPLVSSVLWVLGLVLIVLSLSLSSCRLHSANNQTVCVLLIGAALEIMSLLLVSPLAAFLIAFSIIAGVGFAFVHKQTRAACFPPQEAEEDPEYEDGENHEMFCML